MSNFKAQFSPKTPILKFALKTGQNEQYCKEDMTLLGGEPMLKSVGEPKEKSLAEQFLDSKMEKVRQEKLQTNNQSKTTHPSQQRSASYRTLVENHTDRQHVTMDTNPTRNMTLDDFFQKHDTTKSKKKSYTTKPQKKSYTTRPATKRMEMDKKPVKSMTLDSEPKKHVAMDKQPPRSMTLDKTPVRHMTTNAPKSSGTDKPTQPAPAQTNSSQITGDGSLKDTLMDMHRQAGNEIDRLKNDLSNAKNDTEKKKIMLDIQEQKDMQAFILQMRTSMQKRHHDTMMGIARNMA